MSLDRTDLLGIARAERARLGRTIQYAPAESWDAQGPCPGWRNRDVMAHLEAQEVAAAQVVTGGEATEFAEFREANGGELWVNGFNEWATSRRADLPVRAILDGWGLAADRFLAGASAIPEPDWGHRRVPWVAGEIGVRYVVQSRIVEWWLHGEDIREGAGLSENLQHWPLFCVNDLGIRMLPYALGLTGLSFAGRSVLVDLEGVGGGTWHWALAAHEAPPEDKKPDVFVQGRGSAFALVAGRRVPAGHFLDEGNLLLGGDERIGEAILANVRAYVE